MLSLFDPLRQLTLLSVALRMVLAFLCGGIIGLEREQKRRPAGFRTHILICLGACMTTLTSQYLTTVLGYYTDVARLGAQVVAGIGFIGAGTIIVTKGRRIRGLTTAAGMWVGAIVGLCLGAGYYEGGILVTLLVVLTETVLYRLEYLLLRTAPEIHLYMEYDGAEFLDNILNLFQEKGLKVLHMEVTRADASAHHNACAIFNLRLNKHCRSKELVELLEHTEGVLLVEEL